MSIPALLQRLRIDEINAGACVGPHGWIDDRAGEKLTSFSPTTGQRIADVAMVTRISYDRVAQSACDAFRNWKMTPAPKRGQVVRDLGMRLREFIEPLGELVTLEMGKIRAEGIGEVQEMIDICDFAVGLSRQLCGSTMHSERPGHRMYEQYHPLGPIGIISAFNFPVAVWAWNAALAAVCGDTTIWKPSLHTPLTAIAVQHLCNDIMGDHGLSGLFSLVIGSNEDVANPLVRDKRLPLVSFTGSTEVGREVAQAIAARLGRSLLELGGNNALIVEKDADINLALRAILFGAVGTAGQRCTTTRRVFVHRTIADELIRRLLKAYESLAIGDPMDPKTLMGPVLHQGSIDKYLAAIRKAELEGGKVLIGGKRLEREGFFVQPTIIEMPSQSSQVQCETFAPILYVMRYDQLEQAIELQNEVAHGLSSSIFTSSLQSSERFLSHCGSDCGIANVNLGTSGAEIGGAFGGEKDTGGGRESGSDAWKVYMRRQTNTINWSDALPLAQGIEFGAED